MERSSEDRISRSYLGVLRGFHQTPDTDKLCICLCGCIRLVLYNPTTNHKHDMILDDYALQSIFVPISARLTST